MMSDSVTSAARLRRLPKRAASQRCTGWNRIARMVPQKIAPKNGVNIQQRPTVTTRSNRWKNFW
ncbi:Uncharacterised protein [Burkholderia pseudomallei]|nr:Uncharacterised protein [Burkholderia pseudomallei]